MLRSVGSFVVYLIALSLTAQFLAGCEMPDRLPGPSQASAKLLQAQVQRITDPVVASSDKDELAYGNQSFAIDFYHAVRGQEGNLFFSPYSLSLALAMTYAGARGNTASQMAETLHFTLPPERLHPAFDALDLELTRRESENKSSKEAQAFRLNIANSLWGQEGYPFLSEFLDTLAKYYGAGMRLVDYQSNPEAARKEINEWVSKETEKKIKDLIPPGGVGQLTRLVLANAIYFKADWLHPFDKKETHDAPFTLLDGQQVTVPMMSFDQAAPLRYLAGDGFQVVEMPYQGETVSMMIVLPDAGRFEEFEAALEAEKLEAMLSGLQRELVSLTMPKFTFESKYQLGQILASMGMPDAFDPQNADFSGMDGSHDLYIQEVFHKAFVAVDEKGTEAAAASAVVVGLMALPPAGVEVVVDRPFIFLIRDNPTNTILFLGRVLNPAS